MRFRQLVGIGCQMDIFPTSWTSWRAVLRAALTLRRSGLGDAKCESLQFPSWDRRGGRAEGTAGMVLKDAKPPYRLLREARSFHFGCAARGIYKDASRPGMDSPFLSCSGCET